MGAISQKLRDSARGMQCTLRIPGICNGNPETTVLAHLPSHISGMGTKSNDWHACFACSACHEAIDRHQIPEKDAGRYMLDALERTQRYWQQTGMMIVAGVSVDRPKTRPKRKANMPSRKIVSRNDLRRAKP
ncbi:DUF1364 domain-containing protein [Pararhizobium mangrovi]|uniref:DUF1364 domain-containing protein n=1 Tax=Pararhizobium mangrovi TaxID=2590452 RepID=A0A506TXP4_9HYPH|nr:DUF1364 domain-containing protein [Pararhizobium mangrovi]TPW26843.1 DUF1364 domain-containing protein [Pararhizobium mangrovi]